MLLTTFYLIYVRKSEHSSFLQIDKNLLNRKRKLALKSGKAIEHLTRSNISYKLPCIFSPTLPETEVGPFTTMLVCPDRTTISLGIPEYSTDSLDFKWGLILMVCNWEGRVSTIGFVIKVFWFSFHGKRQP